MLVVIKGAGDLASGVAVRLYRAGFVPAMTDLPFPTAIRRTVSFCPAILEGEAQVEDVRAKFAKNAEEARALIDSGVIAVLADPGANIVRELKPDVLIDAVLAKRNIGTHISDAPIVIALGPGFTAGVDCHAVVETMRGHQLGRVYYEGSAIANTGSPGDIGGYTLERILRAPCAGTFEPISKIGDIVKAGQTVARVDGQPIVAQIGGVLRGILPAGCAVDQGMKSGDVDPRCKIAHCYTVSDKARSIGGGVLEALLTLAKKKGLCL
ncbi:MAG: selenium-dependent molybdenum cofactor biosynthesis protein YqeB [Bacillota bacterium]